MFMLYEFFDIKRCHLKNFLQCSSKKQQTGYQQGLWIICVYLWIVC